ncbi:MAG: YlxR family protein [Synergistetes bacterium]|nr:YlxR family protein [Synergistota bacterium]
MKAKHVPERTCIGCREKKPKRELIRIVRTPEGKVFFDPTGKASGRGCYICPSLSCLKKALKGNRLSNVLKIEITEDTKKRLQEELFIAVNRAKSSK